MPRERREFDRRSGVKDPSLIVIACEGEKTEQDYFNSISELCDELDHVYNLKFSCREKRGIVRLDMF